MNYVLKIQWFDYSKYQYSYNIDPFISFVVLKNFKEEKWLSMFLLGLFWCLNAPVRQSVWCTLLSGQHDPCGLSHSHSCSGTKGRGSSLIGWHLLQVFPAHALSPWRIARQRGLPRYHHLKEYGTGAARVGGSSVWQMRLQGAREPMGGVVLWNFADSTEAKWLFGTEIVKYSSTDFFHRLLLRPVSSEVR